MENTEKEKFESLWSDFTALVKGKLLTISQRQTLSAPLAKLVLSDAAGCWSDEYSVHGRWLQQLSEKDEAKANLVKDILFSDMKFAEVEKYGVLPDYCNYLIPGLGACAGYAISYLINMGRLAQTATVILPAILLYPAVKKLRNNQTETANEKTIAAYIGQLEKYRNSVLSILS